MGELTNGVVPVNRRIVVFDAVSGRPVVQNVPMLTKAQVAEIALAAASQLYVDPNDESALELGLPPSEFYGMTNLEVMLIKQARNAALTGDSDMVEKILDRLIGKPKQTSEIAKTVTYEGYLTQIAQKVMDATPVEPIEEENIFND